MVGKDDTKYANITTKLKENLVSGAMCLGVIFSIGGVICHICLFGYLLTHYKSKWSSVNGGETNWVFLKKVSISPTVWISSKHKLVGVGSNQAGLKFYNKKIKV